MKRTAFFFAFSLIVISSFASHITNGNMYYRYTGKAPNGDLKYTVTLVMYRDCAASTILFDSILVVGIYKMGANYQLTGTKNFVKKEESNVDPQSPVFQPTFCIRKALYEEEIVLPADNAGYLLAYERCCRPTVNNITDQTSSTYYINIYTAVTNNSPKPIADVPILIAKSLKSTLSFANTDADGDSLSYKLVSALKGANANSSNPIPNPPSTYTNFPAVSYKSGFNGLRPFGPAPSYITLDSITGIAVLYAQAEGFYPVSYEVSEFRNGVLYGKYYREVYIYCLNQSVSFTNSIGLSGKIDTALLPKNIALSWNYAISAKITGIELQRTTDSLTNWKKLNTLTTSTFNFNDTSIVYNTSYWYRIKVDTGGTALYSNAVRGRINKYLGPGLSANKALKQTQAVYPNPADKVLFISNPTTAVVTIRDYTGKQVLLYKNAGAEINIEALAPGVYFIEFETPEGISTQRFFKQ